MTIVSVAVDTVSVDVGRIPFTCANSNACPLRDVITPSVVLCAIPDLVKKTLSFEDQLDEFSCLNNCPECQKERV